jgi:hypothetical protein
MRIPFIKRVEDPAKLIPKDREDFIRSTKGGSAFLLAGGTFWLIGALISSVAPDIKIPFIIWGGLIVPVLGFVYGKLQGARFFTGSQYTSLAAIAPVLEVAAIPIMLFLKDVRPDALPGVLMIFAGAHLLVYMWLHMDYAYYIAANVLVLAGILFLFGVVFAGSYPIQMLIAGVASLGPAFLVWRDSSRTLELYRRRS